MGMPRLEVSFEGAVGVLGGGLVRGFEAHVMRGGYDYLLAACNESSGSRSLSLPITSTTLTVTAVRSYSAQRGLPYDRRR